VTDSESDVETTAPDGDDLEELSEDELLEDDDLDDDIDVDDLDGEDDLGIDELDDDDVVLGEVLDEVPVGIVVVAEAAVDVEDVTEEEDDELDDDEVEAGLDVILKERLVVADEDEDEEEEDTVDTDDRGDGTTRVLPKQPGEFVCQSCFLVKNETQLADPKRQYCRDCV
jgi:hypothetical protein